MTATAAQIDCTAGPPPGTPLLAVRGLKKHFPLRSGGRLKTGGPRVRAVDGIDLTLEQGETLGLVGESGSGKTTVGRCLLRLLEPTAGSVHLDGEDILGATGKRLRALRRKMQIIFQDPYASLNPRMTVGNIVSEPLAVHGIGSGKAERWDLAAGLLRRVGLEHTALRRYPHEFSGGQRQRIGIARALALDPAFIVADEPVSALDVSIQAQIINLLRQLQEERGLTYLFISHDLRVVGHISTRVAVMYLGRVVEMAPVGRLNAEPLHPYTRALRESVPVPDPSRAVMPRLLEGEMPSPVHPPAGCHFHPRCPLTEDQCRHREPFLREVRPGHLAACHLAG